MNTSLPVKTVSQALPHKTTGPVRSLDHGLSVEEELEAVRVLMEQTLEQLKTGPATSASIYQIGSGGGLLRARLAIASGQAFGCNRDYWLTAAAACEFMHNASLVHDDFLDGDELRRSLPTVWKKFGDKVALCTGDLLICAAFNVVSELQNPGEAKALSGLVARLSSQVIVGQSVEIDRSATPDSVGFRDYLNATIAKTAPLIEMPLLAGAMAAGSGEVVKERITALARAIGLAYQIIDDLDDLDDCSTAQTGFHPFHAWHFHRQGHRNDPSLRMKRATWHAAAALRRAEGLLGQLDQGARRPLSPFVQPLLEKLEQRAASHRQLLDTNRVV